MLRYETSVVYDGKNVHFRTPYAHDGIPSSMTAKINYAGVVILLLRLELGAVILIPAPTFPFKKREDRLAYHTVSDAV